MSCFEVMACSLFYQFTLYVALRLAHRGFTLGELGLVCLGGTALGMELLNLTIARVRVSDNPSMIIMIIMDSDHMDSNRSGLLQLPSLKLIDYRRLCLFSKWRSSLDHSLQASCCHRCLFCLGTSRNGLSGGFGFLKRNHAIVGDLLLAFILEPSLSWVA
jgi:hypothetical protein